MTMEFVKNVTIFENVIIPELVTLLNQKRETLRNGYALISSALGFYLTASEPFFLVFDEFDLKHVNTAPMEWKKWKIFIIACCSFTGHLHIVHLRTMTSGVFKISSHIIKERVEMVHESISTKPSIHSKLAGAVAKKCAANSKAISFLEGKGIPVLCDLNHFQSTLLRTNNYSDHIAAWLYKMPQFSNNFNQVLINFRDIINNNFSEELKDRYKEELLSLECFLKRIFHAFPRRKFRFRLVNLKLFEKVGALIAVDVHEGGEDGFKKFKKDLADPLTAIEFMATLATVDALKIQSVLNICSESQFHIALAKLYLADSTGAADVAEEAAAVEPSTRPNLG